MRMYHRPNQDKSDARSAELRCLPRQTIVVGEGVQGRQKTTTKKLTLMVRLSQESVHLLSRSAAKGRWAGSKTIASGLGIGVPCREAKGRLRAQWSEKLGHTCKYLR